ncbi:glycoside hydrolase family 2 [Hymenobacter edaphi]|uniref:beta-galactosidase n=2 Tax=Hymenobacter edaphi TaxID=2211146 RepID=A0A328BTS3_9BACT|nr:glycoside hydrolase family 2 [Hymenobacter edaphi]
MRHLQSDMPKRFLPYLLALLPLASVHAQQTQIQYLSGTDKDHTVKWKFHCSAGRKAGKWTTIPVPSNWELQGFGKYNYGHAKDTARGKEVGQYKYEFKVPKTWDGKTVNIVFDGAMTDTEVKINGQSAGPIHQGSYYRFKYDITKLLKPGKTNLLEATVAKHSANESVNDAERRGDFWLFGGIFRPVFLEALPATHISRVAVDAKADGSLRADVYTQGSGADEVVGQLYTLDGQKAGAEFRAAVAAGATTRLQTSLSQARLWTPETPNLYRVAFTLRKGGQPVHSVDKRIGFRTMEVRERDGMYLNGVKVKFKGVNRHSFWPSSGRVTSKALSILDVNLMREMNMNSVRMAHYPPDDHFLAACDSLGLMVLDEIAGWHGNYDTPTGTKLTEEMVRKDENHPSIVVWVNGNEGGHNFDLDPVLDRMDLQKRPVIHAWQVFRGTDTQHYINYDYGNGTHLQGHNVVFPTEFLHGLYDGGHGAGLEDYWEQMWAHPRSAGGFLWDFSDAGVVRTDKGGILDTDGNHGADGILGPYREKEGSFFTIKEVWSPVFFERREITPAFDGTFRVQNRFHFTDLNQCKFTWKLAQLPGPGAKAASLATQTGTLTAPSIAPGGTYGTLRFEMPSKWQGFDVLYITAQYPDGREIYTWSWPIARPSAVAQQLVRLEAPGAAKLTETDSLYSVAANGVELTFSRRSGLLRQVRNAKGLIPLSNGPVLAEGETAFEGLSQRQDGSNVVIEAKFGKQSRYQSLQWTVYPSGWVKLTAKYFPKDYDFQLAGLSFNYPEKEVKGIQWRGDGPYRVWKDRLKGTNLGVWTKAYNNTSTGEMEGTRGPEYPEFKGYYSNFYWLTLQTTGQPLTIVCDQEDVYLRLFTPRFSATPYNTAPAFPGGQLSFMHGISAIGTKSQKAENMGPMGKTNMYYDYGKDPSYAKEMTLYFDFSGQQAPEKSVGQR